MDVQRHLCDTVIVPDRDSRRGETEDVDKNEPAGSLNEIFGGVRTAESLLRDQLGMVMTRAASTDSAQRPHQADL